MGEVIGKQRRYSEEDVVQLRQIHRLHHGLGINLAGVEVILHLLKRLEAVEQELAQERERI
jgi:MerR family transcriptional regulator/heat shock protein HspR